MNFSNFSIIPQKLTRNIRSEYLLEMWEREYLCSKALKQKYFLPRYFSLKFYSRWVGSSLHPLNCWYLKFGSTKQIQKYTKHLDNSINKKNTFFGRGIGLCANFFLESHCRSRVFFSNQREHALGHSFFSSKIRSMERRNESSWFLFSYAFIRSHVEVKKFAIFFRIHDWKKLRTDSS